MRSTLPPCARTASGWRTPGRLACCGKATTPDEVRGPLGACCWRSSPTRRPPPSNGSHPCSATPPWWFHAEWPERRGHRRPDRLLTDRRLPVNWGADWIAPARCNLAGGSLAVGELDGAMTARVQELAGLLSVVQPARVTANIWAVCGVRPASGHCSSPRPHRRDRLRRGRAVARGPASPDAPGGGNDASAEACGVTLEAFDEYDPEVYRGRKRESLLP